MINGNAKNMTDKEFLEELLEAKKRNTDPKAVLHYFADMYLTPSFNLSTSYNNELKLDYVIERVKDNSYVYYYKELELFEREEDFQFALDNKIAELSRYAPLSKRNYFQKKMSKEGRKRYKATTAEEQKALDWLESLTEEEKSFLPLLNRLKP
jgi:hypothetical protein